MFDGFKTMRFVSMFPKHTIIPLNRVFFESVGVFTVCTLFVVSKRLYFMLKTMRLVHVGNLMKFIEIKKCTYVSSVGNCLRHR